MAKIDKISRYLSSDIYQFTKDPFRKLISVQNNNSLEISLDENFSVTSFGEEYNNTTKKFVGALEMNCSNQNLNELVDAIKSVKNQDIKNLNISFNKHYEAINEVKSKQITNIANVLKFEVGFKYNYLSEKYETFLSNNPQLLEVNYPYYYEIISQKYSKNELKNFSGFDYFSKPEDVITLDTIREDLKVMLFDSKTGFDKGKYNYNSVIALANTNAQQFPFCSRIKIDFHPKPPDNLSSVFHDYSLYYPFLQYATTFDASEKLFVSKEDTFMGAETVQATKMSIEFHNLMKRYNIDPSIYVKLNESMRLKNRNFPEMLYGSENHSEVVGYVLNKYDTFGAKSTPIQKWILPNIGNDTLLEYIDTQIKYNKRYKYTVDLILMGIESIYKYLDARIVSATKIRIDYEYMPTVSFYLAKNTVEYTNKVLSSPPIKPYVEFMPYVDMDNQLKVVMYNNNVEKIAEKPITINTDEELIMEEIKSIQNSTDGKIIFDFDDGIAKKFEIYRTDIKPTSYADFNGKLVKTVDNAYRHELLASIRGNIIVKNSNMKYLETAAFVDQIVPNKFYYYTFRSVDYHDQFSNPTEIYEVIHTNGILSVQPLDLEMTPHESTLTFRRYLQITPAVRQTQIDDNSSDIKLGLSKESLWDKKFKIRLISKSTGKKIDFNLTFKYNKRYN